MATVNCPVCEGELNLDAKVEIGEIHVCPDCGAELEVIDNNPLTVEEAPAVEEDWGE